MVRNNTNRNNMSRSERRILANKIRRRRERRKNILLVAVTLCLVFILSFVANGFLSNAKNDHSDISVKYYKSIMVERGDTLWSIATEHTDTSTTTVDLVNEIKQLNNLHGDTITCGSYLIIPYYSNEMISIKDRCSID